VQTVTGTAVSYNLLTTQYFISVMNDKFDEIETPKTSFIKKTRAVVYVAWLHHVTVMKSK